MEIPITPQELVAEKMRDDHLAQAVNAIREEGYIILADVINHDHLDLVRERMDADSQVLLKVQKWGGAGQIPGHLSCAGSAAQSANCRSHGAGADH